MSLHLRSSHTFAPKPRHTARKDRPAHSCSSMAVAVSFTPANCRCFLFIGPKQCTSVWLGLVSLPPPPASSKSAWYQCRPPAIFSSAVAQHACLALSGVGGKILLTNQDGRSLGSGQGGGPQRCAYCRVVYEKKLALFLKESGR